MDKIKERSLKEIAYALWCTNDIKKVIELQDPNLKRLYNNIPVYWCRACKSLAILDCDTDLNDKVKCFCSKCCGTDIIEGTIEEWEKLTNKNNNK